ncbi:unnamed protein product [Allacma fusca]|uniref:Uncharacterized protein n=1 Tax=Allacma fusca TaxID=39272 RepID=A0A8J2LM50_9HEXA|nr:unnamed protein product [Allacma fusca]
MKFQIYQSLIACLAMASTVTGFFDGVNREVLCKGQVMKHTNVFNQNVMSCVEEFKAAKDSTKPEERKRGKTCIALCALTKDGLFDDKGAYQIAKMSSNIEMSLPGDLAAALKSEMETCVEKTQIATVVNDPADTLCAAYKPFFRCTALGWMKTCIEGFDPEIWSDQ